MGVVGTLGTSDAAGTSQVLPIGVNPATGAMYVQDLAGASGTTNVQVLGGTLNAGTVTVGSISNVGVIHNAGTIAALPQVSVGTLPTLNLTTGTITTGSLTDVAKLYSGTINVGTVTLTNPTGTVVEVNKGTINVLALGTIGAGTVAVTVGSVVGPNASAGTSTTAPVQVGGTTATGTVYGLLIDSAGNPQIDVVSIPQVSVGTIPQVSVGTIPAVNMASGTLNVGTATVSGNVGVSTGTITTGSLTNLASLHTGTITTGSLANVTMLHGGTLATAGTVTGVGVVTSVSNLVGGTVGSILGIGGTTSVRVISGTTNLAANNGVDIGNIDVATGTITSVSNLAAGTIQLNKSPVQIGTSYFQLGTAGASFWGTIIAASGAGTKQYVSGVQILGVSGTVEAVVTNIGVGGSAGAGVLTRGWIGPGAGIAQNFDPVIASGTNGTISYWLGGAGTVDITIQYWQGV